MMMGGPGLLPSAGKSMRDLDVSDESPWGLCGEDGHPTA